VVNAGRDGVPGIPVADAAVLRQIEEYVDRRTLYFTWLNSKFVIFSAPDGFCDTLHENFVLNGACNEWYVPHVDPTTTLAIGGACFNAPRPWIKGDKGLGTVPWEKIREDH
jgi:hypothetical protein